MNVVFRQSVTGLSDDTKQHGEVSDDGVAPLHPSLCAFVIVFAGL